MEISDAEAFVQILRDSIREVASVDYPRAVIDGWAPEVTERSIRFTVANPENELRVVAEIDGQIVGIGATMIEKRQLRACYVSPVGLRKGVGTAIVNRLEEIAKENGLNRFELDATITAEPFYQKLGYTSVRRMRHQTSAGTDMDAVFMTKNL